MEIPNEPNIGNYWTARGPHAMQPKPKLLGPDLIRHQGLVKTIIQDYRANPRFPFAPGFIATANYRYGCWTRTLPKVLRRLTRVPYWLGYLFTRDVYGIELFDSARIGRRLNIAHQSGIVIHLHAEIGDDCVIRHCVTFGEGTTPGAAGPIIGDRVSFGPGTVVLGPVRIGDDVSIGPNCTIWLDIPAGTSVVANRPTVILKAVEVPHD
jgi:serine O-acetyltransferase